MYTSIGKSCQYIYALVKYKRYNLDLHNLEKEDLVSASDPRTQYRWLKVKIMEVDLTEVSKMNFDVDEVIEKMKNATIEKKTEFFL